MTAGVLIKNKQANFEYFIIEKYEAGIQLMGTEIKSIRAGKATITDVYWQRIIFNEHPHCRIFFWFIL